MPGLQWQGLMKWDGHHYYIHSPGVHVKRGEGIKNASSVPAPRLVQERSSAAQDPAISMLSPKHAILGVSTDYSCFTRCTVVLLISRAAEWRPARLGRGTLSHSNLLRMTDQGFRLLCPSAV